MLGSASLVEGILQSLLSASQNEAMLYDKKLLSSLLPLMQN
jgi:hypothetical protein